MVDNSTWAGMLAMNLHYAIHCEPCDRIVDLDMTKLPPDGKAIGVTFRCSQCGKPGRSIVSHKSANHQYPGAKPFRRPA